MPDSHERALKALERRGRLRSLSARSGIDFSSNDYLGLADAPELRAAFAAALERGVAVGAGGSRLLRGNDPEHEALEAEAAEFFGSESALYFGGGFMANVAIFSTLPDRGDVIIHDELIHASVHDGMRASKAEHVSARHNDAQSWEDAIVSWRNAGGKGKPWIAVESLYSMDGDRAPLDDLVQIADRHDGVLVIDEAHATGVFGPKGRGLGAHLEGRTNVVSLHTCGKALGVMGALVLAPSVMRDFFVNRCRPFIYATAPSPLMAAGVRAALDICQRQPERRERLNQRIASFGETLTGKTGLEASGSQIQPVIVGPDTRAVQLAEAMQARGFDIRAVRPPTVPEGTARLRISITLNPSDAEISGMLAALAAELQRLGP
jgi:8-amino-7-oxononanoate synthase